MTYARLSSALVLLALMGASPALAAKERLVVMKVQGEKLSEAEKSIYRNALVEGLSKTYTVLSGDDIDVKVREIAKKEGGESLQCGTEKCFQEIVIAFQAELIATAVVLKVSQGYMITVQVSNVLENTVIFSKSEPCEGCSEFKVISYLKTLEAGKHETAAGQTAGKSPKALKIDADVKKALERFHEKVKNSNELIAASKGLLVFPSITKVGLVFGGEYGKGALVIDGGIVDYYSSKSLSFGIQFGAQSKTVILLFTTDEALAKFRKSRGWKVGVDGSVVVAKLGVGGAADTNTLKKPIVGFVFGLKGLMLDVSLEGSKIKKLKL
ncbi:MAG: YSC84-related protein [Nitrospinota bacterium]